MLYRDRLVVGLVPSSWHDFLGDQFCDAINLSITILFTLGSIFLIQLVGTKLRRYSVRRAAQRRYGCRDPPRYPHKDWAGRDLLLSRQAATKAGQLWTHYDDLHARFGLTWEENQAGRRLINTADVRNLQQALTLDGDDYGRFTRQVGEGKSFMGSGIMTSNGARWKFSREKIKPIFTRAEVGDTRILQRHVSRLISILPNDGSTVDIQPLFKKMFLDSATEFIFGESTDSLLPDSPYSDGEFLKTFDFALAGYIKRRSAGVFAYQYWFDTKYQEAVAKVYAFLDGHVKRALRLDQSAETNEKRTSSSSSHERHILLYEMAKEIRDPIVLRHEVLNVFVPSRDTSAVLLSNALFQLARHPDEWQRLRTTALALDDDPDLSFELLKSLKPFRNVIDETLRSLGPSGHLFRFALRDIVLPHGGGPDGEAPIFVHKGDQVSFYTWGLHHNKEVFGEDVYEFRPDRWNELHGVGWKFVPFGGGRRICPAQQQAIVQAIYVLVRLTRHFESIENRDPVDEYVQQRIMMVESRNGAKVALFPAN